MINAELARCLPCAAQAVIPHASHVVHMGNPAAYHAAVREFLARSCVLMEDHSVVGPEAS